MSNYKWSTGLFQCDANQNNGQGLFEFASHIIWLISYGPYNMGHIIWPSI